MRGPLVEQQPAAGAQHVQHEVRHVAVRDRVGEEEAGDLRRRHGHVGARLLQQRRVLLLVGIGDDARARVDLPHREDRQRVGVVAPGAEDHGRGRGHARVAQDAVHGGIAPQPDVAGGRRLLEQLFLLVHDHDLLRRRTAAHELGGRGAPAVAVAADHHVVLELLLQARHADALQSLVEEQLEGRADEHQPDQQPGRGDDDGINEPRALGDGDDVAVADGGQAHHHEVDQVHERKLAVDLVADALAVQPQDARHQGEQAEDDQRTDGQHAAGIGLGTGEQDLLGPVAPQAAEAVREGRHAAPRSAAQGRISR